MTKTKRGVGGSFTSCFDKTLCFCVMQRVFCEHLDSLPGFMEPENLHIYNLSTSYHTSNCYYTMMVTWWPELIADQNMPPVPLNTGTGDTCWIHAGYMLDTCRSGVMVRAISSLSSANYASVGINFTHKQHGYLETCLHTLSSCSCCLNVDLLE